MLNTLTLFPHSHRDKVQLSLCYNMMPTIANKNRLKELM